MRSAYPRKPDMRRALPGTAPRRDGAQRAQDGRQGAARALCMVVLRGRGIGVLQARWRALGAVLGRTVDVA
jgi:hypothetical protein